MKIHPSTGKALDSSGAFAFLVVLAWLIMLGWYVAALGSVAAVVAFSYSWLSWHADSEAEAYSLRVVRICAAIISAALFALAAILWALA